MQGQGVERYIIEAITNGYYGEDFREGPRRGGYFLFFCVAVCCRIGIRNGELKGIRLKITTRKKKSRKCKSEPQ